MARFGEIAIHSVSLMFSLYYKYLLCCFPHFGCECWTLVLIAPVLYNRYLYAAITLKIQSADRIFVFLSADKHQFVGRLKLLH